MGTAAPREVLLARWTELINDPSLQDLPYKIELNETGKIEMSPATNRHGFLQAALVRIFAERLPSGETLVKCSILTPIGVRVADVAWISHERSASQSDQGPYLVAPEICVEIVYPTNSKSEIEQKIAAYLAAGAFEVWIVNLDGDVSYRDASGERTDSAYVSPITLPPRRKH